jgi:PHP family Zn ribbon phosphoesterase
LNKGGLTLNKDAWVSLNGGIDPADWEEMEDSCSKCGTKFKVVWNEAAGFSEREEYYCPECRTECGTVRASNIPRTVKI